MNTEHRILFFPGVTEESLYDRKDTERKPRKRRRRKAEFYDTYLTVEKVTQAWNLYRLVRKDHNTADQLKTALLRNVKADNLHAVLTLDEMALVEAVFDLDDPKIHADYRAYCRLAFERLS